MGSRFSAVILCCLGAVLLDPAATAAGAPAAGPAPTDLAKLSTNLKMEWEAATSWHAKRRLAECFVKIDRAYTEAQAKELARAGLKVRSVLPQGGPTTTIVTGQIRLRDLPRLAAIAYVRSIEGAAPVGRKGPMGLK